MCFVHEPSQGAYLSILSARDIAHGPVCKVHIPGRVPNGFHANWMENLSL